MTTPLKNISLLGLVNYSIPLMITFMGFAAGYSVGAFYFGLALFGGILFIMYLFALDPEERKALPNPFERNIWADATQVLLGAGLVALIAVLKFGLIQKVLSPKLAFSAKFYQILTAKNPMLQKLVYGVFTAGNIEEFTFGITAAFLGMLIALFIYKGYGIKPTKLNTFPWALAVAGVFFTIAHTFNPTYTASMFVAALVFRLIMTSIIFLLGFYSFAVGFHMFNNLISLVGETGGAIITNTIFSFWGLLFWVYLFLIFGIAIYGIYHKKFTLNEFITP